MTTPADIAGAITRRVEKHLHDVQGCWPHAFPVRLGTQRELEADPVGTFDADNAVRAWAERHGCRIETVRRRVGTPVDLVARVVVPDEATALRAAGREAAHGVNWRLRGCAWCAPGSAWMRRRRWRL